MTVTMYKWGQEAQRGQGICPRSHSLQWACIKPQMDPRPKPRPLLSPFRCTLLLPQEAPRLTHVVCGVTSAFLLYPRLVQRVTEQRSSLHFHFLQHTSQQSPLLTSILYTLSVELPFHLIHVPCLGSRYPPVRKRATTWLLEIPLGCMAASSTHRGPHP